MKMIVRNVLSITLLLISCAYGKINPVILVPGDGGSQIEAKIQKSAAVHYLCEKETKDFFNIWLNMELLAPIVIDCWIDNIRLVYDNVTRKTTNPPGVETRVPGFGSTEPVEWLDPSHASTGAYFKEVANALVGIGYERNKTIKGAPYDFRKAPNENQDYFVKLKQLIEDTYAENGNTPVILLAHSMGGPMCLYLLNLQTQQWKDKYVRAMYSLSAVWGGSFKALKVFAIGDDLGSYFLRASVMRQEQITNPSLAWLLPSPHYWKPDEVLIETSKKNYTLTNLKDYFTDADITDGWEMYKDTKPYTLNFTAPGVEVHCLYGVNVPTVEKLYYKPGTWLDGSPTLIKGDGDGTVNLRSLEGCLHWKNMQKQEVHFAPLPAVDHMTILSHPMTISYIISHIRANSEWEHEENEL